MRSGTLFSENDKMGWFSLTLFRKNWGRFWPLAVGYGLVQFFLLPMALFLGRGTISKGHMETWVYNTLRNEASYAVLFGAAVGLFVAMALFSYLMNNRSAGMLHALPMRREGLFLTNWVTGLSFFLIPNALVTLCAFGAEGLCGYVAGNMTLRWFALHTVIAMFFFCFAVCCAMFTGHILALPVFYGVLNVLVMGLSLLIDNALSVLLLGYEGTRAMYADLTVWLTPAWHLHDLVTRVDWAGTYSIAAGTAGALGYSVVGGAVFTFIAVATYHHRQLERAGDVVTVAWVRPVFQCGVGVCLGLTVGTLLYDNFFRDLGAWGFVALVCLWAVIGAFVGRMFLKKTLRVFTEGWKGCVALGLCMLALLGGARADLFGYQRWTPDPDQVERIIITSVSTAPYDSAVSSMVIDEPELIREMIGIHAGFTADLDRMERFQRDAEYLVDEAGYVTSSSFALRMYYRMKDGREVARKYYAIPVTAGELADPASYAGRFQALLNRPELLRESYLDGIGMYEGANVTLVGGQLINIRGEESERELSRGEAELLWAAFQEDLEAGRIHRYLMDDREREENCYYTDVNFDLYQSWVDREGKRQSGNSGMTVTVQGSASSMMKALEEMGVKELLAQRGSQEPFTREVVTDRYHIYEEAGPQSNTVEVIG